MTVTKPHIASPSLLSGSSGLFLFACKKTYLTFKIKAVIIHNILFVLEKS